MNKLSITIICSVFTSAFFIYNLTSTYMKIDEMIKEQKKSIENYTKQHDINNKIINDYNDFIKKKNLNEEFVAMTTREIDRIGNNIDENDKINEINEINEID